VTSGVGGAHDVIAATVDVPEQVARRPVGGPARRPSDHPFPVICSGVLRIDSAEV
jgi:hypothetical protein